MLRLCMAALCVLLSLPSSAAAQARDAVTLELGGGIGVPTCNLLELPDSTDCNTLLWPRGAVRLSTDIASPSGGGAGLGVEYRRTTTDLSGRQAPDLANGLLLTARGYSSHPTRNGSFIAGGLSLDLIRFGAAAASVVDVLKCKGTCDGFEGMGLVLIPIAAPAVGLVAGLGAELGAGYRSHGLSAGAYLMADLYFIGAEVRGSYSLAR